jgi:hypothetical protein
MLRVWKDDNGKWWADINFYSDEDIKQIPKRVDSLAEWPEWLQTKLTILACSAEGYSVENVGKRIAANIYWVYNRPN